MELGGSKNKQQMLRWLLDDFQQGIKCRDGKHMHLVDDIHPHLHLRRRIHCIIPKVTHIVNTIVGGSIDLQYIHAGTGVDGTAGLTAITWISVIRFQAVYCLGQYFRTAGLSGAPGTGKQIRMAHSAGHQLGILGLGNSHLPRNII